MPLRWITTFCLGKVLIWKIWRDWETPSGCDQMLERNLVLLWLNKIHNPRLQQSTKTDCVVKLIVPPPVIKKYATKNKLLNPTKSQEFRIEKYRIFHQLIGSWHSKLKNETACGSHLRVRHKNELKFCFENKHGRVI